MLGNCWRHQGHTCTHRPSERISSIKELQIFPNLSCQQHLSMGGKGKKKVPQVCSCEHMCPELSADILQCAVSVCERRGKREIIDRAREGKGVVLRKKEKKCRESER